MSTISKHFKTARINRVFMITLYMALQAMIKLPKKTIALLFICLLIGNAAYAFGQKLPKFHIMTEDWHPYQFEKDGKLRGISVDLLVLILEKIGSTQGREDINLYPWARGYDMVLNQENTILFSTTRTPEREQLFKWVGPIFKNSTFLIARKSRNLKIDSAIELNQYRIGTIIDDASELFMTRHGVPLSNLQRNTKSIYNVRKLAAGRIDFIVSGWIAFEKDARRLGLDPDLYEKVYEVDTSYVYYAFNRKTPDWIIQKFQNALNELNKEDKLGEIENHYFRSIH